MAELTAEPEFGAPGGRMYHPKGFTRTPEVRAILDPYEDRQYGTLGGCCHFERLPVTDAERLLALLPPEQAEDVQNFAPSFADMVRLLRDLPGATVHGYRIVPERADERITLEGFEVSIKDWDAGRLHDLLSGMSQPDESYIRQRDDGPYLWVWWD